MSNFLDRIIEYISPDTAFRREKYRTAINVLRSFDAASRGRRTSDWRAGNNSANAENLPALAILRNRSRSLVRNNPYAKNAIDVICTNTVGAGIMPTPIGLSNKESEKIKSAWAKWAETTECDYNGRLNFYGIQKLVMRAIAESGEVIILKRKVPSKQSSIGLQLQILESDFLDVNKNLATIDGGGYIFQGIEFDQNGKRIAYWLYEVHPGENSMVQNRKSFIPVRYSAEDVIHIYNVDRPGQERGIPMGVSAFLRLHDFDEYEDAQLVRQKIAACFAVFVQDAQSDTIVAKPAGDRDEMRERVEPGIIEHLPAGKTVTFASPPSAEGYGEYSKKILQAIACAYGVTYEALTNDLSNVNFSSGRMGWLEFHRKVEDWQYNLLIPTLCTTTWKWFCKNAFIAMQIDAADTMANWTPPRRAMIDPVKETTGITNAIRAGLLSPSEAVRQQGYIYEEVMNEYAKDLKLADQLGIILDVDMRYQKTQSVQSPLVGAKNS